jgi:hypothetical protein
LIKKFQMAGPSARDVGEITPVVPVGKRRPGSAYGTWRFQDKNKKGDLLIPETVSAYIQHGVIWVKSKYGKTQIHSPTTIKSGPFRA